VRQECVRSASEIQKVLAYFGKFWVFVAICGMFWQVLASFGIFWNLPLPRHHIFAANHQNNSAVCYHPFQVEELADIKTELYELYNDTDT
jgi:hypothetical protein